MAHRVLNWDTKLVEWAEAYRAKPFEWGVVDCVSAARDAYSVMFDEPAPEFSEWQDAATFTEAIESAGGAEKVLTRYCRRIGIKRVRTGDLVWSPTTGMEGLGGLAIIVRDKQMIVSEARGVDLLPLEFASGATAWRYEY